MCPEDATQCREMAAYLGQVTPKDFSVVSCQCAGHGDCRRDLVLASIDNGIYWSNEPCWRHAVVFAAAPLVVAVTGAGGTGPEHRGQ